MCKSFIAEGNCQVYGLFCYSKTPSEMAKLNLGTSGMRLNRINHYTKRLHLYSSCNVLHTQASMYNCTKNSVDLHILVYMHLCVQLHMQICKHMHTEAMLYNIQAILCVSHA